MGQKKLGEDFVPTTDMIYRPPEMALRHTDGNGSRGTSAETGKKEGSDSVQGDQATIAPRMREAAQPTGSKAPSVKEAQQGERVWPKGGRPVKYILVDEWELDV